jgi:uncharacterized membrane protein
MLICPHCNQKGITYLRRSLLGPAVSAKCSACGEKIGVPWGKSALAILPAILAVFLGNQFLKAPEYYFVVALGAVVMALLFFFYVPLIKK